MTSSAATVRENARPTLARPRSVSAAAADVLIFERVDQGFVLVGGAGRRAGWAGIVELGEIDDGLVGQEWRRGLAARMTAPRLTHVAGPYYAQHAVAVPVGQDHVVVTGEISPSSSATPTF
jgi:hypothetical protein